MSRVNGVWLGLVWGLTDVIFPTLPCQTWDIGAVWIMLIIREISTSSTWALGGDSSMNLHPQCSYIFISCSLTLKTLEVIIDEYFPIVCCLVGLTVCDSLGWDALAPMASCLQMPAQIGASNLATRSPTATLVRTDSNCSSGWNQYYIPSCWRCGSLDQEEANCCLWRYGFT